MKQIIDKMEVRIKDLFDMETISHGNRDYTNYAILKQTRHELIYWREKLIAEPEQKCECPVISNNGNDIMADEITIKLKKEEIERIIEIMENKVSPFDMHIRNQLLISIA